MRLHGYLKLLKLQQSIKISLKEFIKYGNDFSNAFGNDDFLKLVATGIREDDSETEPIEILLAEETKSLA